MDDHSHDGSLTEEKASRVLDRASQLEAQEGGEVDIADLRRAALDAGIPADAFERALAEVRRAGDQTPARPWIPTSASELVPEPGNWPRLTALVRAGAIGVIGSSLAAFAHVLHGLFGVQMEVAGIFSLILALFLVCALAVDARRSGGVRRFLFDLALLWAGMTMIFMVADPNDAGPMLALMSVLGGATGVLGSVFVALGGPAAEGEEELPPGDRRPTLRRSPG